MRPAVHSVRYVVAIFLKQVRMDCARAPPPPTPVRRVVIYCNLQSESCTPVSGSCSSVKLVKGGPHEPGSSRL